MKRLGPILIILAVVVDALAGIGLIISPTAPTLTFAVSGAIALGVVLVYGGSWLTFLYGDVGKKLMLLGTTSLLVHFLVATTVGLLGIQPLVAGTMLFVSAFTAAATLPEAWSTVSGGEPTA